ncbi:MAG: HD domain-containing phosphohydrolase [Dehalococcoidia bacterium]
MVNTWHTISGAAMSVLTLPGRRIRWKLMLPYAFLTVAMAALGSFLIIRFVTGSLEERFTNQLVESGRVASDAMVRRERLQLTTLRSIAYSEGMAAAVESRDSRAVANLAHPVAVNARAERVEILDSRGSSLFGTSRTADATYAPSGAEPFGQWSIVADVLAGRHDEVGDKWAQLVWTADGMALFTAGPVIGDDGRVVGVVLVGSLLAPFLPSVKGEALADVTVYDLDGEPLASTFVVNDLERKTLRPPGQPSESTRGRPRVRAEVFGRSYDLLYGELVLRREVVGLYSVALPSGYIASAGTNTGWRLALLFGGATLGVLGLGLVLGQQLTRPLLRLVSVARQVASGDLSARSGLDAADEIGQLAASIDVMTQRLQRQHMATIGALASAIDARDPHTAGHSVRVGNLSVELGREMGLKGGALHHLQVGGLLHDVGKIGIRDSILLKEGRLTAEERRLIEEHPQIGLRILEPAGLPPEVLAIVGGHHERVNGTGYPNRLRDEEVTAFPRIAAVADVYDALTADRPYRKAMSVHEVLEMLEREAGDGLLDPDVVQAMRRIAGAWEEMRRGEAGLTIKLLGSVEAA